MARSGFTIDTVFRANIKKTDAEIVFQRIDSTGIADTGFLFKTLAGIIDKRGGDASTYFYIFNGTTRDLKIKKT